MNIRKFLMEHFDKEEIQDIALYFGSSTTGKKNEIVDNIVFNEDFDIWDFEDHFNKDQLYLLCFNLSLPVSGNKGELWERIVTKFRLDKEIPIKEEIKLDEKPSTTTKNIVEEEQEVSKEIDIQDEYTQLEEIIRQWVPERRYKGEEGYQAELSSLLKFKHGFKVQNEAGSTQIDILVNEEIPIELKKNPNRGDFDRLGGQIIRNIDTYGKLIVVICQLETRELFMEYKKSMENRYSAEELVYIVKS